MQGLLIKYGECTQSFVQVNHSLEQAAVVSQHAVSDEMVTNEIF